MKMSAQIAINRVAIHEAPKRAVIAHLRHLGHRVDVAPTQARFDLVLDGRHKVALRVAYPTASQRRVHAGDRCYDYVYQAWNFNFHHRGEIGERYSDFFACVPMTRRKRLDLSRAFVIPWRAITGKTFYLPDSRRAYGGKYAVYRNAWEQLKDQAPTGE